jgi:hypothetical protein
MTSAATNRMSRNTQQMPSSASVRRRGGPLRTGGEAGADVGSPIVEVGMGVGVTACCTSGAPEMGTMVGT